MKLKLAIAAVATLCATSAFAWEGQVVKCYGKVWKPAEYNVKEVLSKPSRTEWVHRNDQLVELYYAPVYKEVKTLKHAGHWVKREEACKG